MILVPLDHTMCEFNVLFTAGSSNRSLSQLVVVEPQGNPGGLQDVGDPLPDPGRPVIGSVSVRDQPFIAVVASRRVEVPHDLINLMKNNQNGCGHHQDLRHGHSIFNEWLWRRDVRVEPARVGLEWISHDGFAELLNGQKRK